MSGNMKNKATVVDSTHSNVFLCHKTLSQSNPEKMLSKMKINSFNKRYYF